MKDLPIKVERSFPPIPDRSCDLSAWVDGEGKSTTCMGATASEALISPAERIDESPTHDRKEQTHG